jgi:hypothetical protein
MGDPVEEIVTSLCWECNFLKLKGHCAASGCYCCHDGCDFDTIHCCYVASSDCLCLRSSCCLSFDAKPLGCGMTTTDKTTSQAGRTREREICKIGCMLCDCAVTHPITKLCGTARQCLCCYMAASIPFSNLYMDKPVCGFLCLQCTPNSGCCTFMFFWRSS